MQRVWEHNPTLDAPSKYRRACKYEAFIPDPLNQLTVSLEGTVAGVVSAADAAIRSLNDAARPALAPLARLLLRTESIASSQIEGMQMGVRELARVEAKAEGGGKVGPTALEVLANIDAMELAVDQAAAARRCSVADIVAIHHRLMERVTNAERIAGKIRGTQNWIGGNNHNPCGADFVPPPPEDVPLLLEDLREAVNDDLLPPIVQAALVHAQFETIHPFADGNGRTGRALIHVVLKRRGVAPAYVPPISVVLSADRDRYIAGLTGFRKSDAGVVEWIEQFAVAAYKSAALASRYLREIGDLSRRWAGQLTASPSPPRSGAAAWALIDVLPAHPIITAPVAAAETGRAKSAIYEAIGQLSAAGVLRRVSESKRNQAWEVVGLLDLLERLEAGERPETGGAAPEL